MLLSHKTTIQLNNTYSDIVGHMCYAAYKLWNVCNYERINYVSLKLTEYPDWYYQKKAHKDDLWYKNLPSQTAQEVCKQLDKAWKSFYELQNKKSMENPQPPRFKHDKMVITYMQNAIVHDTGSEKVRLSLPRQLMEYLKTTYGIDEKYLYLKNKLFQNMDSIKQIKIYPPDGKGKSNIIIIYEVPDVEKVEDNGHYLSIDLGLHNLMTCYDNRGKSFIVGRKYLSIHQRYDKEIARVQSQWGKTQAEKGIKYPKPSKHLLSLYNKKRASVNDYLHKITRWIADYCKENEISKVIIGDITGIRKGKDLGNLTNQKLHSLPYQQLYMKLQYKLAQYGIEMVKQTEAYSSQCSPYSPAVAEEYADKGNRVNRGLYIDRRKCFNADAVGAFNILRLYRNNGGNIETLSCPEIIKVAV